MRRSYSCHGLNQTFFIGLGICMLCCAVCLMTGCAQRVHINSAHGNSYKSVFYQQASTPSVQLAPTTAEDAKRISNSRVRRTQSKSAGRRRSFVESSISGSVGN